MGSSVIDTINWQQLAAQNNADLYAHMFAVHSLPFHRSQSHFQTSQEPLPFYSNVVTLAPNATEKQTSAIKTLCETAQFNLSVKDSFNTLDLAPFGFRVLFEATWFYIKAPLQADVTGWEQITTPEQLAQWKASGSSTESQNFWTTKPYHFGDVDPVTAMMQASLETGQAAAPGSQTSLHQI